VAGEAIAFIWAVFMRVIRVPLFVELTSNIADASGVNVVAPIPTLCEKDNVGNSSRSRRKQLIKSKMTIGNNA